MLTLFMNFTACDHLGIVPLSNVCIKNSSKWLQMPLKFYVGKVVNSGTMWTWPGLLFWRRNRLSHLVLVQLTTLCCHLGGTLLYIGKDKIHTKFLSEKWRDKTLGPGYGPVTGCCEHINGSKSWVVWNILNTCFRFCVLCSGWVL